MTYFPMLFQENPSQKKFFFSYVYVADEGGWIVRVEREKFLSSCTKRVVVATSHFYEFSRRGKYFRRAVRGRIFFSLIVTSNFGSLNCQKLPRISKELDLFSSNLYPFLFTSRLKLISMVHSIPRNNFLSTRVSFSNLFCLIFNSDRLNVADKFQKWFC